MRKTKITVIILNLFLCIALNTAVFAAADPPPIVMLKDTANKLIAQLERYRGRLEGRDRLIYSFVRRIVMPRCDLNSMSQSVVGRTYWQQASPALRKQFVDEFSFYVVRTYSGPLSSYDGETIKFYPIRGYNPVAKRLQVDSDVIRHDGPPVRVSYRLYRSGSNWRIYDFSVEGVSIVLNYRSQFASTLSRGGLEALVKDIRARNRGA